MTLNATTINELASYVEQAQLTATAIPKLTNQHPDLDLAAGYEIQDALRARVCERGERIVGFKCGLTSKAKMVQMGVNEPGYGFLSSGMACDNHGAIVIKELVHPRVEAEVALILGQDLKGPNISAQDVLNATAFVAPALEVIDSRFEAFKFDLPSVMADNASSARFVLGERTAYLPDLHMPTLGVVLEKNGEVVATAAAAAVMGHPAEAAAALINHLGKRDEKLESGAIILTGGVTEAIAVSAGDRMFAEVHALGEVSVSFK